ncbi:hypothetical protein KPH14_003837 [Odynerus spinipes]|uniref:Abasic site processing protein HMCES n=1 Tax=Odynerus spinipes TaxID=1348599 RepID=A0AAD9RXE9_9HYME|nr:hypothetical protein KPH14_003837 [Odynerus spinipes]
MCGRGACTLSEGALSCACGYKNSSGKYRKAPWIKNDELVYVPSCNIGPRAVVPCTVAGTHFSREEERIVCPMFWGLIPPWHKGDYRKHKASSHNSRLDRILESKLFGPSLRKGLRCAVIFDGYYEWKASGNKSQKQPYYIYATQKPGIKADDPTTWPDKWSSESGWEGYKPLKMAGIFNRFKTDEGKIIYSCAILTTDSNKVLSWLHDRVPVFLNEENCEVWLDLKVSANTAIDMLKAQELSEKTLSWHPVSTLVNNVSHKDEECRKEIQIMEKRKSGSATFMASWLKKKSGKSSSGNNEKDDNFTESETEENERPAKIKKKS